MEDMAVANLCREWLAIYEQAIPSCDNPLLETEFSIFYGLLSVKAPPLAAECKPRELDGDLLSKMPPALPGLPNGMSNAQKAYFQAGADVSLLLRVITAEAPADKRIMVALNLSVY